MTTRILLAAFAIALMMANASAQGVGGMGGTGTGGGGGGGRHQQRDKTDKTEPAKPKVDEKAYNDALKTIPDKHSDAWGGMR